ncbi:hypothetical protein ACFSMW_14960 [Virgibacillus halophilus]|uniref:RNA polymerase subunit sigma-70 n=1 Tax=Tigheibacillus halophilus TaxID=361280 RepID=A0ABU5CDF0_9BACI|nr:hypothetical protein [Virgibacillus halophilus]
MRTGEKHWQSSLEKTIFGVNYHRFLELESDANHMEIAQELGISLGEVKMLKKKLDRA